MTASGASRDASDVHSASASVGGTTRASPGATRAQAPRRTRRRRPRSRSPRAERVARDLVVQRGALRPELEHRAEHRDALPAASGVLEQLDRRARRARIGVVRVVDQRRRAVLLDSSRASAAAASPRCRGRVGERDAELARDGEREHRIAQVVHAAKRHVHVDAVDVSQPRPSGSTLHASARRSPASRPAAHDARRARLRAASTISGCDAGTIGDGHAVARRELLAQHALEIAQSFEMLLGDRRHDRDVRLDDRAQRGDLARLIRSHLDHGDVGARRACASSVSGTPTRLLRLPVVACTSSAAAERGRSSSFVLVLPFVPTTPTTGLSQRAPPVRRQRAERDERVAHLDTRGRRALRARRRATRRAPAAPFATASLRKSCASNRSPTSATNRSPGSIVRVSVQTRPNAVRAARQVHRRQRRRARRRRDPSVQNVGCSAHSSDGVVLIVPPSAHAARRELADDLLLVEG